MSDRTFTKIPSELKETAARAYFYLLLAVLFRVPQSVGVQKLVKESRRFWTHFLKGLNFPEKEKLAVCLNRLGEGLDGTTSEEWTRRYETYFGHTPHSKVPAYELEYGEEHSHRQPQELADITAFYRAFGLQISPQARERPDHISVECEFMYFLLHKEVYACGNKDQENANLCRDASHRFLRDHLGEWLPAFAFRLSRLASEPFVRRIAEFALNFVLQDCCVQRVKGGRQDLPVRVIQENIETGCVSCPLGSSLGNSSDRVL